MNEEEVRIPVILDVEGEGELDDLHRRLSTLKATLDEINRGRKIAPNKPGQGFGNDIEDSIKTIGKYEKALSELANDEHFEEHAEKFREGINREIGYINDAISKSKSLQEELDKTMQVDEFSGHISSVKELNDYMDVLKSKLQEVQRMLNKGNGGTHDEVMYSDAIKSEIEDIEVLTKDLGTLSSEWAKANQESANASKSMKDTTNYMRKQFAQMYSSGKSFSSGVNDDDLKVLAERNEEYKKTIELNQAMKDEAVGTANRVVDSINFEIDVLNRLIRKYGDATSEAAKSGKVRMRASEFVAQQAQNAEESIEKSETAVKVDKEAAKATQAQIKALKQQQAEIRQTTAQYYYSLRALKMGTFILQSFVNSMGNFGKKVSTNAGKALKAYLKLIPGVSLLQKKLSKATTSQKQFNKAMKETHKTTKLSNMSLGDLIKNVLKYGLGIRSLFVLFNKLRSAMMFGFENMAKQFESVNKPLSSLLTSFTMMKNAIATVVQPIVNVLAPVLEKISALFTKVTYKVASFIAALTGQKTVFRAVRVQQDYAASLDKTAKSAKKAKQELSGLDKLNVLTTDKSGDDDSAGNFFEEVPIDSTMADWANKFKEFLDRLLAPIKAAWEKMKDFVIDSWKFMCEKLKSLWKAVVETFWRVWEEGTVQHIFETILHIVGNIMRIVGTLAGKIEEAWRANDNGYRILLAIVKIIDSIVTHIDKAVEATLKWAEELTLVPLFTAIADVLTNQILPAVDKVLDLALYLYTNFILPLAKDFIENNLPKLVRAAGNIAESIGNIAENIQKALEKGDKGKKIVEKIETIAGKVADTIERMSEDTKNWTKELDFNPLFESLDKFLEKIQPGLDFLLSTIEKLWKDVVLPFWKYLIEDGGPKLLDLLGKIFGEYDSDTGLGIDWEHLTDVIGRFIEKLEPFLELAWETLLQLIEDLGKAFDDFVNSGTLDKVVDGFGKFVDNADPKKLATTIEIAAGAFMTLYGALKLVATKILPVMVGWKTIINLMNNAKMAKDVASIAKEISTLKGAADGAAAAAEGTAAAAEAAEATTASAAAGASGAATAATVALGVFDAAMVAYDVGKLVQIHNDWEKADDEHEQAVQNYCDSLTNLYNTAGQKAVNDFAGTEVDMEALYKEWETSTGTHKTLLGNTLAEYSKIYEDAGNAAVSAVAGTNTTLEEEMEKAHKGYEEMPHNMWEGFKGGWDEYFGEDGKGLGQLAKDAFGEMVTTIKDLLKIGSPSVVMEDIGDDTVTGLQNGLVFTDVISDVNTGISNIISAFSSKLTSSTLTPTGNRLLAGLNSGMQFGKCISTTSKGASDIVKTANNGLKPSIFDNIGRMALAGLQRGISNVSSIMSTVSNVCSSITSKFTSLFRIGSPSKLFEYYGNMLDAGLKNGIEEGSDDITDSFDDMMPSTKMLDSFYDKFMEMMNNLTLNVTDMFDEMFLHIQESMASLEKMMNISDAYRKLDKLPDMKLPSIVSGQTLPSNKEFKQSSTELDLSKLPGIIKNAVIEAITDTANLQTDDGDTIIEIDGREIFRVVRNENSQYKKQHGASAFA